MWIRWRLRIRRRSFSVSRVTEKRFWYFTDLKDADILTTILKRIFAANKEPVLIEGEEFYLERQHRSECFSVRWGGCRNPSAKASSALRVAKESSGRNNYQLYADDIDQVSKRQMRLEAELYRAKENGELVVYYQPKVDLKKRRYFGMEASVALAASTAGIGPAK